jgi:hypothetical protein
MPAATGPASSSSAADWQVDTWRDHDTGRIRLQVVWPIGDPFPHEGINDGPDGDDGSGCPCGPGLELLEADGLGDRWMVTHQALDGRD